MLSYFNFVPNNYTNKMAQLSAVYGDFWLFNVLQIFVYVFAMFDLFIILNFQ